MFKKWPNVLFIQIFLNAFSFIKKYFTLGTRKKIQVVTKNLDYLLVPKKVKDIHVIFFICDEINKCLKNFHI